MTNEAITLLIPTWLAATMFLGIWLKKEKVPTYIFTFSAVVLAPVLVIVLALVRGNLAFFALLTTLPLIASLIWKALDLVNER